MDVVSGMVSAVAVMFAIQVASTGAATTGLEAPSLSLPARILAVADVYDALARDRPYRAAMPAERVLAILDADAGARLDADSVAALRRLVDDASIDLAA